MSWAHARGAIAAGLVACVAALAAAARAQAPQATITAPHRLGDAIVAYPASATGAAGVVVELLVDRQGAVTEARRVEGEEPFAHAALAAAVGWRFAPAMRGGQPVAARIRVEVLFTPPKAGPAAAPAPSPAPALAPPDSPNVAQVLVRGVRPEPARSEMTGGEVRQMPGAFGDAFRAIEALPGVTPIVSGLPYFLVRGAPPGDTGFFVEDVHVPALFHLGVGAAVIHPGLIDKVDLYPGAYPARFGRFTGGILAGVLLPVPEHTHAEAELRLIDAGLLVATPLDGGRADVLVSGRYGYPGALLSLFAPSVALAYWDYQTRARYRPTDRDEMGAFFFGSFDNLTVTGSGASSLAIEFHRADLHWDHRTGGAGRFRLELTLGYDLSSATSSGDLGSVTSIQNGTFALRGEWLGPIAQNADLRVGVDAVFEPYALSIPLGASLGAQSAATSLLPQGGGSAAGSWQTDFTSGAYGELVWQPASRVQVRAGARADVFTSRAPGRAASPDSGATEVARVGLDPRLTVRFQVTGRAALVTALGVAHQASNVPLPSPGLQFSQLSRGLQTAYQYSQGVEVDLPWKFAATGSVFVHDYTGLADYYDPCAQNGAPCFSRTFDGRAVGLEVLVKRSLTERLTGWIAYTLSRSERDGFFNDHSLRRLSEFDRTHVLNFVLAADLGKKWRAGARWVAYSGLPYSTTRADGPPDARGPPFFRLDLRLEKRWHGLGGTLAFVVEWLNALLQRESLGTTCSVTSLNTASCQPTQLAVPITLPSVGLEGTWP